MLTGISPPKIICENIANSSKLFFEIKKLFYN